jgi:hypothetical protein
MQEKRNTNCLQPRFFVNREFERAYSAPAPSFWHCQLVSSTNNCGYKFMDNYNPTRFGLFDLIGLIIPFISLGRLFMC